MSTQFGTNITTGGNITAAGTVTAAGASFTNTPSVTTAQSMVRLNTANGYGSTNTMIRRFTNTVTNQGTDITYADSATLGASFTINVSGVYAIMYGDAFSGAANLGISLNTTQPTTGISVITIADRIAMADTASAGAYNSCSTQMYLPAGSVVRAHTAGTAASGPASQFTITRVS